MAQGKVEICGVNTAKLPLLGSAETSLFKYKNKYSGWISLHLSTRICGLTYTVSLTSSGTRKGFTFPIVVNRISFFCNVTFVIVCSDNPVTSKGWIVNQISIIIFSKE